MKRTEIQPQIHLVLCSLIAFFISFKFLIPVFIVLLLLNWIVEGNFKSKFSAVSNKPVLYVFISLYLFYLIGMLYSSNKSYGWADLQTKLSLLIFPIIFSTSALNEKQVSTILRSFVSGVFAVSLSLLGRAIYLYFTEQVNYFYYVDFSYFLHPSYFGMFVNLAMLLILFNKIQLSSNSLLLKIISLLFLLVIIVLLSSKLALLSSLLIIMISGINYIISSKKYKVGFLLLFAFLGSIFILIKAVPELNARIQNAITALNSNSVDKSNSESNAVRMLVWNAASDALIQNGALGVGTGDVKDELFKQYELKGYSGALEHKLNAHNQFLQTGVALGFVGLIVFLATFLVPIYFSWRYQNYLFISFSLLVLLNCLTESMLEAEAGVIFISFFQSLLFFNHEKFTPTKFSTFAKQ